MKEIMKKLLFTEEDAAFMLKLNALLNQEDRSVINDLKEIFFMKNTNKTKAECTEAVTSTLDRMAESKSVHKYSLYLLFLLLCYEELEENFKREGYTIELFYETTYDITCKLKECKTFYGITGVFAFAWLHSIFLTRIFSLGRFQFTKGTYTPEKPYVFNGITVNPGDIVYYIHIPSTGPMPKTERLASYKKAYDFFGTNNGDNIVLVCESWLLAPENENLFPEKSNLLGFHRDFDIVRRFETKNVFNDAWRVFNLNFNGDTSILPENTALQRNFKKWLQAGNKVGYGYGVIIFDGERIVNK